MVHLSAARNTDACVFDTGAHVGYCRRLGHEVTDSELEQELWVVCNLMMENPLILQSAPSQVFFGWGS